MVAAAGTTTLGVRKNVNGKELRCAIAIVLLTSRFAFGETSWVDFMPRFRLGASISPTAALVANPGIGIREGEEKSTLPSPTVLLEEIYITQEPQSGVNQVRKTLQVWFQKSKATDQWLRSQQKQWPGEVVSLSARQRLIQSMKRRRDNADTARGVYRSKLRAISVLWPPPVAGFKLCRLNLTPVVPVRTVGEVLSAGARTLEGLKVTTNDPKETRGWLKTYASLVWVNSELFERELGKRCPDCAPPVEYRLNEIKMETSRTYFWVSCKKQTWLGANANKKFPGRCF